MVRDWTKGAGALSQKWPQAPGEVATACEKVQGCLFSSITTPNGNSLQVGAQDVYLRTESLKKKLPFEHKARR